MDALPIDAVTIDETLVRDLLVDQAPQWAHLPIRRFEGEGNDHRLFRLGGELSVRLPAAARCVPQVEKEQAWLPRLAEAGLPLPIPRVLSAGTPSERFGAPWSVYDWIPGTPGAFDPADKERLAIELADFLVRLRTIDASGGPPPGLHTAYRGAPLAHGDDEVRSILHRVEGRERDLAAGIWRDALDATFDGPPVWFHGDVSLRNLLSANGRLAAVIDFGCAGIGDPACDTVIGWTAFEGRARALFREHYAADEATWARGRGWTLWKGLIMITNTPPGQAEFARHVLDQVFADD